MNKVVLIGRLTADAEVKTTQQGKYLVKFRLAVSRDFDKEKTDFFSITYFVNKETFGSFLKKGRLISLAGRIEINEVESDGVRKSYTNIIANEIQFLDKNQNAQENSEVVVNENSSINPAVIDVDSVAVAEDELPF